MRHEPLVRSRGQALAVTVLIAAAIGGLAFGASRILAMPTAPVGRGQTFAPGSPSSAPRVTPPASRLAAGFAERLEDENGDGFAEELVLSPTAIIETPGTYILTGQLTDADGIVVGTARAELRLAAGRSRLDLRFDGVHLYSTGRAGPYHLEARLLDHHWGTHDLETDMGPTKVTDIRTFQHEPSSFDPASFTDAGIDVDGDGLFDYLEFTGSASVETAGTHRIGAQLDANDWSPITIASSTFDLAAGPNRFDLRFDGAEIAAFDRPGPFRVVGLRIYLDHEDLGASLSRAHVTRPYTVAQFERPRPSPSPVPGSTRKHDERPTD